MEFKIMIDQFEGPLDLMLHLIRENKLDLFDLDMNVLTEQYLAYLDAMESMHLEIASEYLSELAALLEYKSKKRCQGRRRRSQRNMRRITVTAWWPACWNISASRKSA